MLRRKTLIKHNTTDHKYVKQYKSKIIYMKTKENICLVIADTFTEARSRRMLLSQNSLLTILGWCCHIKKHVTPY